MRGTYGCSVDEAGSARLTEVAGAGVSFHRHRWPRKLGRSRIDLPVKLVSG